SNHHNRDSPEELRSASGSADGSSLDGLDALGSCSDGGSPTRDSATSSAESTKGDGDSEGEVLKCPDCS
ncbi:unnamed protein product, partial [Allacma fusca]